MVTLGKGVCTLAFAASMLVSSVPASAQVTQVAVSTTPAAFRPDQPISITVTLTAGSASAALHVYLELFKSDDDGRFTHLHADLLGRLHRDEPPLSAGETRTVTFTRTVPTNTSTGAPFPTVYLVGGAVERSSPAGPAEKVVRYDFTCDPDPTRLCTYRRPVVAHWILEPAPESLVVGAAKVRSNLLLALLGTRLQISQTDVGDPLVLPDGTRGMSYVDLSKALNDRGAPDHVFDVPIVQHGVGQVAFWAITGLTHGFVTADNVRFMVNNLHSSGASDAFSVSLEEGAIVLTVELESASPTVKCEANGYTFALLIPIPVGWRDDLCPDAQFQNARMIVRLVPAVNPSGRITIGDISTRLEADIDVSPIDFLADHLKLKDRIRETFAHQVNEKLRSPELTSALSRLIHELLEEQRGKPFVTIATIGVDEDGLSATGPKP